MERLVAMVLGLALCLTSVSCATPSRVQADSRPRVLRPGQLWSPRSARLSPEEERSIEAHAHYAAGVLSELSDDADEALSHYQAAIERDPDNETLTVDVARKLVELRRLEDARKILERATRRGRGSGMVWGWLGTVYSLQGNPKAAIAANQEAIRRMPNNIGAHQNLAQIYLEAGQVANALEVLERAAEQPDADTRFLIVLANTLGVFQHIRDPAVGNLRPRIIALLDRAAAQNPEAPVELLRLADLYLLFGQREKALPIYEDLLTSEPDLPGLRERLAEIYLRAQDRAKAVEQLQALAAIQPTNPLPHYYLGVLALESKNFDDAVAAFNRVLLLRPDNQAIYFDLAIAHLSHNRPEEALSVLERARGRFRSSFQLEFYSAIAALELEQFEQAIRHFTAAEVIAGATDPSQLTHIFFFQSGIACERAKRFDDAAVQFERALELKPDFADALNYLGYMWAEQGLNLPRALELIQKAVDLEPDNAAYLDSLAWVYYQMGDAEKALPHQARAVELSEEPDPTLFDHLGDIYRKLGRDAEARDAWEKALQIKDDPEIREKLDAL